MVKEEDFDEEAYGIVEKEGLVKKGLSLMKEKASKGITRAKIKFSKKKVSFPAETEKAAKKLEIQEKIKRLTEKAELEETKAEELSLINKGKRRLALAKAKAKAQASEKRRIRREKIKGFLNPIIGLTKGAEKALRKVQPRSPSNKRNKRIHSIGEDLAMQGSGMQIFGGHDLLGSYPPQRIRKQRIPEFTFPNFLQQRLKKSSSYQFPNFFGEQSYPKRKRLKNLKKNTRKRKVKRRKRSLHAPRQSFKWF